VIVLRQTSATSAPLHPQKSNFFSSPLSRCFTSPSLLHVCLSPSVSVLVSGAPLSLPYLLIQPLTPYFSLMGFSHTPAHLPHFFPFPYFLSLDPTPQIPIHPVFSLPLWTSHLPITLTDYGFSHLNLPKRENHIYSRPIYR
jgi:hypothetical protein